jgi:hypothetical protein
MGAWSAVVWSVAWATCSRLHRSRQHMHSRRLQQELARATELANVMQQVAYEQEAEIAALKFTVGQR